MRETNKIDMDVLDQIISLAEDAMIKPFKKKKPGDDEEEEKSVEIEIESKDPEEESIGESDLEKLMEEYKRSKGR